MIVFAQVSDTHFGEVLANKQPGTVAHQDPHSLTLCLALYSAFENARAMHKLDQALPLPVVHSGDLTLCGAPEEFAVAHAFMRSRPRIRRAKVGGQMGLDLAEDKLAAVPGNHDHWCGLRGRLNYAAGVPAYTPAILGPQFRPTPWTKTWREFGNDDDSARLQLELFGVDSSSGLGPGQRSWWARGMLSATELQGLETMLRRSRERHRAGVVRVVVCHHSFSYRAGWWGGGMWQVGELDAGSRDALLRLCADYHVTAVLTGHTHDFHRAEFQLQDSDGAPWTVNELRCASTLAINHPAQHNGFWVHRIGVGAGGGRAWTAWRHGWNGSRFVTTATPTLGFAVT